MKLFHTATDEQIKSGLVTDVYFDRTIQILREKGADKVVSVEVRARTLPNGWEWAVLAGVEEALHLLEGLDVEVRGFQEGTLFHPYEPVLSIAGRYTRFAAYETPVLGFLCQASGIATAAARCRIAAGERTLLSFGARRMHPAIAPMIERAAYIGGCDGVSTLAAADLIEAEPSGTMPHALILVMGDTLEAVRAFHEVLEPKVRRVALIDTFQDEKFEALRVAEALGQALYAVRLDTPSSRRGDMLEILREVRWELDLRGHTHVRLFLSGGIGEEQILRLNPLADGYGVGTHISNAPTVDFALDIVEIEGVPMAKRGKRSGRKAVYRCPSCGTTRVVPWDAPRGECPCGGVLARLDQPLIQAGKVTVELPSAQEIRQRVLAQLKGLSL
ncbi:MAG: nicotinate phosphoribosyltransferase [Anaerolineae bacterium]